MQLEMVRYVIQKMGLLPHLQIVIRSLKIELDSIFHANLIVMSCLIRIYLICRSAFNFYWIIYLQEWEFPNSKMAESTSET